MAAKRRTEIISLSPEEAFDDLQLTEILELKAKKLGFPYYSVVKRSLDARKRIVVHVQVSFQDDIAESGWKPEFKSLEGGKQSIIVGSGPAGLFAAISCLEAGVKPIILERGKDVRSRRRDIADINKKSIVHLDSNYCFGEGGAGTYSDGKLYTRSAKRGNLRRVLEIFHYYGAKEEILYDSHPHIGTNKLPDIVYAMREGIIAGGGEVHFESAVEDFIIEKNEMKGVVLRNGDKLLADAVLLATGHSARDIYERLYSRSILIESKPFAIGIRVEHPQSLIDSIQYRCEGDRDPYLPASSYSLANNVGFNADKRGVFSFCMCPGGFIVPSSTADGEIVVNGMSPSRRDSKYANSGIVVSVLPKDYKTYLDKGPLAGMYFQRSIEQRAFKQGVGLSAPTQRIGDFMSDHVSKELNETSYQPGLYAADFREILPSDYIFALKQSFKQFGKKMKGYMSNEGQMVGIESRTSSPVRIPRDPITFEHLDIQSFFPLGEGAGYAGGIVSAAMDGMNGAERMAAKLLGTPVSIDY